ncbi:MAG: YitT family protein [Tannerella sp.]|jgi:uncharacterized membrane-anchored protein YitT (DUF2179 family)|nr:YitT family protein [Tannerella sp.]
MKRSSLYKIYHPVRDYVFIVIGTLLYGFGFNGFILSNEVVPGGLTGICSLLFYLTKIPVSVSYAAVNVLLLFVAYKLLGVRFMVNSIFGVVSLTLSLMFFEWLLGGQPVIKGEPFMSILIGGALCGSGLGIIFTANGSTGGTDIVGAIVNKYRNISIGRTLLFCDFFIIGSSYFLFHNIDKIVFGIVEMAVNNYVLDRVLNANNQSVQFLIFSQKHDEIAERIIKDLGRGCTILDGQGGYTREPAKVIVLLAKSRESVTIFRMIRSIDHQAFISQSSVRGVYGEGFDPIKY